MADEETTRWEIIDAAYGVLVADGYDEFTTQAVADAAGVSQSLIHYYFDTKQDLLEELWEVGLDGLTEVVEQRADVTDPRERVLELVYCLVQTDTLEDGIGLMRLRLELKAQAPYDAGAREVVEYDKQFLAEYFVDAIEDGIESSRFRSVDSEAFAALILAAVSEAQNRIAIFGEDASTGPIVAAIETLVNDYLVLEEASP